MVSDTMSNVSGVLYENFSSCSTWKTFGVHVHDRGVDVPVIHQPGNTRGVDFVWGIGEAFLPKPFSIRARNIAKELTLRARSVSRAMYRIPYGMRCVDCVRALTK